MNDASREAFEAWLAKHDPRSFCPNAYWEHDYKWKAWQASRKQALADAADFLVGLRNEPDMQFLAAKIKELK